MFAFSWHRVDRGGDSSEPVCSPGGDRELDVVGSEESGAVVVTDVPVGLHDVGETVGANSDLLEALTSVRVVNEPWGSLRANGHVGLLTVEEELGGSHVDGDVWNGVIGGGGTNSRITGCEDMMILIGLIGVGDDEDERVKKLRLRRV